MWDIASPGVPVALSVPFGLVENAFRRLSGHVQDMELAELEFIGGDGNVNSTATLLAHLAFVDLEYLHLIKGVLVPDDLLGEYGPPETERGTLPVVTGLSASQLLARYRRVIDMIREYLQTQTDADAVREVQIPWWPESATVRHVLWHMAAHSMHHQGQIVRLSAAYRFSAPHPSQQIGR